MKQSHSWKVNIFAAAQELPSLYGVQKVINIFTRPCHFSVLSQMHAVHVLAFYFFKIHFNIILVFLEHKCMK